jgi:hypothetical protein
MIDKIHVEGIEGVVVVVVGEGEDFEGGFRGFGEVEGHEFIEPEGVESCEEAEGEGKEKDAGEKELGGWAGHGM